MTLDRKLLRAEYGVELPFLNDPTLFQARLAIARQLVVFSFIWPFFNYKLVNPGLTLEINFLPVFLAAILLPEVALRDKWSVLLSLLVLALAAVWADPTASMRLAIGIVPLHFLFNLTRHLQGQGKSLIRPDLAYRLLQVFVALCIVQTIQFRLFPVIPEWVTAALMAVVPRYMPVPYDNSGVRGVQGWASEPSSAALMCIAFAIVAISQRPDRRWRVLGIFVLLLLVNRSIYALALTIMLSLCCLFTLRRKQYVALVLVPTGLAFLFYIRQSARIAEMQANLLLGGLSIESNRELQRFAQILLPIIQFPHIYIPPSLLAYGDLMLEPLGLLPLVIGYGSVLGLLWLVCVLWRNFGRRQIPQWPLALLAGFVILFMASPDLIPAVVALAVFVAPKTSPRTCPI